MCGIVGYIGHQGATPILLDGLRSLEYRGYDSAGVAVVSPEGIALRRSAGKLANLEQAIRVEPVDGCRQDAGPRLRDAEEAPVRLAGPRGLAGRDVGPVRGLAAPVSCTG